MRSLFIVAAKLLGLYQLMVAVLAAAQIIVYLAYYGFGSFPAGDALEGGITMTVMAAYYLIIAAIAAVIAFKTERLADLLRIPQDDGALFSIPATTLLTVGAQLIGLFLIATNLPAAAVLLAKGLSLADFTPFFGGPSDFPTRALTAAVGGLLIWRADFIVRVVQRQSPASLQTEASEEPEA